MSNSRRLSGATDVLVDVAVRDHLLGALHTAPRIVLAVSGGVDSMAMLHAAARSVGRDRLVVATFDHGTGPFARAAVEFVGAEAEKLGLRFVTDRELGQLESEAELREARWDFLRRAAADVDARIATAHTRDDHLETVLMRVLRGAGARGLAALLARSDVLRPLLDVSRAEVVAYLRARELTWLDDPSNVSLAYLRNRVRLQLLPALRAARPELDQDLLNISRAAAEWRTCVEAFVDGEVPVRVLPNSRGIDVDGTVLATLSRDEASIVWPAILARRGVILDRRGLERIAGFGVSARVGARMQLSGGWQVVRSRDALQLRASEDVGRGPKATLTPLALSKSTVWGASATASEGGDWSFRTIAATSPEVDRIGRDAWSAWLPADRVLTVRPWQAGDTMVPGAGRTPRKIKLLLSEAGVTGHQRAGWPVVLADDQIIWVPGVRRSPVLASRSAQSGLPFICDYFDRHRHR